MSLLAKTATGFLGLGACSITSLILANQYKAPSPIPVLVAPPAVTVNNVVAQSIKKLIQEGYKGCANLDIKGRGTPLFVCLKTNKDGSHTPFFFYYGKNEANKFQQVKQVKKIRSSSYYSSIEVKFVDDNTKNLNLYPVWFKNIQNSIWTPEKICKVEEDTGSKSAFTLKCNNKPVQSKVQI